MISFTETRSCAKDGMLENESMTEIDRLVARRGNRSMSNRSGVATREALLPAYALLSSTCERKIDEIDK